MLMFARCSAALLFVVAGCASCAAPPAATGPQPATSPSTSAAATPGARGVAPKPHTLEALRAGCPAGRVVELRVEAEGKPTVVMRMTFGPVDAARATVTERMLDEKGGVLSEETNTSPWTELSDHAAFPADETQIEDTDVEVPAGRFRAKLYTVVHGDTVKRLWFATELPGPPVSYTTVKSGKEVLRMTMVRAR